MTYKRFKTHRKRPAHSNKAFWAGQRRGGAWASLRPCRCPGAPLFSTETCIVAGSAQLPVNSQSRLRVRVHIRTEPPTLCGEHFLCSSARCCQWEVNHRGGQRWNGVYVLRKLASPAQIPDMQTIPVEVSDFYLCCVSLPACGRLSQSKRGDELREAPPHLQRAAQLRLTWTEEVPDVHKTFLTYPTSKQVAKPI